MKINLEKKLKRLNVVIASHIYATGPALDLEEFLQSRVKSLFFVGHPFSYRKETNSFYRLYAKGKLKKKYKAYDWKLPEALVYLKDAFYTFWWVGRQKDKIDLFIGSDNFLAFLGILLKRAGKVRKVILYTIDYVPQRFDNPILNFLYHFFDKQCLEYCEVVWNVSLQIAKAREKFKGLRAEKYARQIIVPLGIWYDRIPKLPFSEKDRYRIIFLGHLLEKQGVQVVIEAMPKIVKRIPQVRLVVIGTGPYEKQLKNMVTKKKLGKHVSFLGYIKNHRKVEQELAKSTLAVATYKSDPKSFTYFADPGKIKAYLGAGLPIVLTDVPPIAKTIKNKNCGYLVEYGATSISDLITDVLKDTKKLKRFSKNALKYARKFDWNKIFGKALETSL